MFLRSFKNYVDQFNSEEIYIAWDKKLNYPSTNFRKELLTEYKGTRDHSDSDIIHESADLCIKLTSLLGVRNIFPGVMEADDVIAWLVHNLTGHKTVVTADHDLWQLVDSDCNVYHPRKKIIITVDNFEEHANIDLKNYVKYKAIIGDQSDNITGLSGVGPKRAKRILDNWDYSYERLSEDNKQLVNNNLKMVDLSIGYNYHDGEVELYKEQLSKLRNQVSNFDEFINLCKEYGFNQILNKQSEWRSSFNKKQVTKTVTDLVSRLGLDK